MVVTPPAVPLRLFQGSRDALPVHRSDFISTKPGAMHLPAQSSTSMSSWVVSINTLDQRLLSSHPE